MNEYRSWFVYGGDKPITLTIHLGQECGNLHVREKELKIIIIRQSYFISCTKLEVGQSKRTDGGESVVLSRLNGLVWRDLCMISALLLSASTASQSNSPHSSMHSSAIGRWRCSDHDGRASSGNPTHEHAYCVSYIKPRSHWLKCRTVVGQLDDRSLGLVSFLRLYIPLLVPYKQKCYGSMLTGIHMVRHITHISSPTPVRALFPALLSVSKFPSQIH